MIESKIKREIFQISILKVVSVKSGQSKFWWDLPKAFLVRSRNITVAINYNKLVKISKQNFLVDDYEYNEMLFIMDYLVAWGSSV